MNEVYGQKVRQNLNLQFHGLREMKGKPTMEVE
jgi:hypothetical protein